MGHWLNQVLPRALLCVAVLLLGCVPTRLANQGGSKDEPTATKAARKVIKGASTVKVAAPVQVEQKAEKEGTFYKVPGTGMILGVFTKAEHFSTERGLEAAKALQA